MGKKDNEDITVLQDAWFRMIGNIVIEDDLKKEILTCKKHDKQVQSALEKADSDWGEESRLVPGREEFMSQKMKNCMKRSFENTMIMDWQDTLEGTRHRN